MTRSQVMARGAIVGLPFAGILAAARAVDGLLTIVVGLGLGVVLAVICFVWAMEHDIRPSEPSPLDAAEAHALRLRQPHG